MVLDLAARFERLVLERLDARLNRAGGPLFGLAGREQRRHQQPGAESDQTCRQGIALGLLLNRLRCGADIIGGATGNLLGAFLCRARCVTGLVRHRRA